MATDGPLQSKICLITGGTSGIGLETAVGIAQQGATVIILGHHAERGETARQEISKRSENPNIEFMLCNLASQANVNRFILEFSQKYWQLHILVLNAAIITRQREETVAGIEKQFAVNHLSQFLLVRQLLDRLITGAPTRVVVVTSDGHQHGRGHFVNIGSIAGRVFVGGSSAAYGATKAAVDGYTQALDFELKNTPVNATLVRLGTVAGTDFLNKHVSNDRLPPFTKFFPALTPPKVATAVLKAIYKKQAIITRPRYLEALTFVYNLSPRFSRWLSYQGGANNVEYSKVSWKYKSDK